MFKTEAEARGCWCPLTMNPIGLAAMTTALGGEFTTKVEPSHCRTSRCMAWRLDVHANGVQKHNPGGETRGYCGLAGHPAPMFVVDGGGQPSPVR